jgi:hypothetical protein
MGAVFIAFEHLYSMGNCHFNLFECAESLQELTWRGQKFMDCQWGKSHHPREAET